MQNNLRNNFAKYKTMNKKERLEAIIKHYSDGKPSVFAKLIGVAPSTISSWLSRDTLDYDLLFAKCENLSSEWLLTGRGEMINIQTATFNNTTTLPQKESTGIEDKLLAIIADKDATIREMAEEIGALKQTIVQLKTGQFGACFRCGEFNTCRRRVKCVIWGERGKKQQNTDF